MVWRCDLPTITVRQPAACIRSVKHTEFSASGMPLWRTPCTIGMRPVIRLARFGMQIGEQT